MKKYLAAICILLLLLTACGGRGQSAPDPSPEQTEESASPPEPETEPAGETERPEESEAPVFYAPAPSESPVTTTEADETEPLITPYSGGGGGGAPTVSSPAVSAPAQTAQPTPAPTPAATPAPYSERTEHTILTITGSGVSHTCYFTLEDLKGLKNGYFSAEYFSRRTGPEEATNTFSGVKLSYLLESVAGLTEGAKKITVASSDSYAYATTVSAAKAVYMDENVPGKNLYMILAWNMDGSALDASGPLMLVNGQQVTGEYNRQFWVKSVTTVTVSS